MDGAPHDLGFEVLDAASHAGQLVDELVDGHVAVLVGGGAEESALGVEKVVHSSDLQAAVVEAYGHAGSEDR